MSIKVILIGRHTDAVIPGVVVVRQENIEWALQGAKCTDQLWALRDRAVSHDANILLQNTPAILAVTIYRIGYSNGLNFRCGLGVLVNKPSTRREGKIPFYEFDHIEWFVPATSSIMEEK